MASQPNQSELVEEKSEKKTEGTEELKGIENNPPLLKRKIAEILVEEGKPAPKSLDEISEKLNRSTVTVRKWLKGLETLNLIEGRSEVKGRGRPKIVYYPTPALLEAPVTGETVPVPEAPEAKPAPPAKALDEEDKLLKELEEKLAVKEEKIEAQPPAPPGTKPPEPPVEAVAPPKALEAEDELLKELEEKLGVGKKVEPRLPAPPEVKPPEPSAEAVAPRVQPASVEQAAAAPQAEATTPVVTDEELKSVETDAALAELQEKIVTVEKVIGPREFEDYCTFELPAGFEEVERYWVVKPFAWASILFSPEQNERLYYLVEPSLTPAEKTALEMIHGRLLDRLVYDEKIKDRDRAIADKTMELLREYGINLPDKSIRKLIYYLKRNYTGYGKIDAILRDPNTEDLSCDGTNVPIFVYHRKHQSLKTNLIFKDAEELDLFVIRLVERAGKQISLGRPTVDASMTEGYRLQATLGTEVTTRGSSFSIRKYAEEPFTPVDLILYGTFSPEMLAYLWLVTENKKNIMVVGGTASGKTSTLNALSMFIWPDAKIVSIEDTRELALYQENWIPAITRPAPGERSIDMYELLRNALRQRPEVIIVGEIRGKEALTLFQAMTTGHTVYSTMHAGAIQEMVHRLEGEPIVVPHHMLASLDVICLQLLSYFKDQRVRRNQSVVEITGIDPTTGSLRTNRVFERNPLTDEFEKVGESHVLREIAKERGWSALQLEKELRNRRAVLQYLANRGIKRMAEVAAIIRQYHFDSDAVMKQIVSTAA